MRSTRKRRCQPARQALAAHPGDPRLSVELARALEESGGSDKEIAQLYEAAHDGGNLAATTYLAGLYEEGRGVVSHEPEALSSGGAGWNRAAP